MNQEIKARYNEVSEIKPELKSWVNSIAKQCNAKNIHWCDGSKEEYDTICGILVKKGTFIKLNPE